MKYGMIAGNGSFPFLVLEGARKAGVDLAVVAIKEETDPRIDAGNEEMSWVGIGQLGKMISFFKQRGVSKVIMAGQVKHAQLFSGAMPDLRMVKMLWGLPRRNTDALIGGVAAELANDGIELIDSTFFIKEQLAPEGVLTKRKPTDTEALNIEYGLYIANEIARLDLGQTIVVRAQACVAIEAMEGTDATIHRAGELANGKLTVVKVAKPNQDMRFDVPVVGVPTIRAMIQAGATCLSVTAGQTLIFDREEMIKLANSSKISIMGSRRETGSGPRCVETNINAGEVETYLRWAVIDHKMKKKLTILFLLAAFVFQTAALAQAPAIKISDADKRTAEAVTAKQLSDYLHFVASDEMEGRDTPSRGLDLTAKFIAMNLSRWGFKPAGDNGTFFQKIALGRESLDAESTKLEIGGKSYKLGEDFFRLSGSGTVNGPLVFGRDGWMVKSKSIDAFAGVDVKGKVVVISSSSFSPRTITGLPQGVTQAELREGKGTEWADAVTNATQKGAVGIIVIAPPQLQSNWAQFRNFGARGAMFPEKLRAEAPPALPVMLVSQAVGDAIFAGESGDRVSSTAFAMNKSAGLSVTTKKETVWTQNVVAVWEGSDPVLMNEMVAVGAHYDHVGVNPNAPGDDKIFNGADDDGSGTVGVLAIAEALAKTKTRPKRSVLFVWHCGEEKGLWGSEYFNKFPTVDIKQVTAQLNINMIGRSKKAGDTNERNKDLTGPHGVYVIGAEMMSSTLGAITKGTNDSYLKLDYDYRYDDPKDTNRFFFRSDHFNYALNGIPIVFWFDGVHEDYHRAGDEPQKIDYEKMEKVTRTIMLTLLNLADLKERPKVDKQLPPELTTR